MAVSPDPIAYAHAGAPRLSRNLELCPWVDDGTTEVVGCPIGGETASLAHSPPQLHSCITHQHVKYPDFLLWALLK